MKRLLNTLFVLSDDAYLALDGENVVVNKEGVEQGRVPLHNLEGIVTFGYTGASPALMGSCAKHDIALSFMSHSGRFLARVTGEIKGNIVLRRTQYKLANDEQACLPIAKGFIHGKLYNCRSVLERALRDYPLRVDCDAIKRASDFIGQAALKVSDAYSLDELRGIEGEAAKQYFSVFDNLILQQKEAFFFHGRSRRPPMDNMNALLSFLYALLTNEVAAALETVGLDPYEGFLHRERPGRKSLALDVMEELRPVFVDRLALSLVNMKVIAAKDFQKKENGSIVMEDESRRAVINAWQDRKKEEITHPFLKEKMVRGLIPHAQSMLLSRLLRGDIDAYPPYFWK